MLRRMAFACLASILPGAPGLCSMSSLGPRLSFFFSAPLPIAVSSPAVARFCVVFLNGLFLFPPLFRDSPPAPFLRVVVSSRCQPLLFLPVEDLALLPLHRDGVNFPLFFACFFYICPTHPPPPHRAWRPLRFLFAALTPPSSGSFSPAFFLCLFWANQHVLMPKSLPRSGLIDPFSLLLRHDGVIFKSEMSQARTSTMQSKRRTRKSMG